MPTCEPPLYILYPVTPTASVEAVHEIVAPVEVIPLEDNPVGTVGGVVSLLPPAVVVNVLSTTVARLPEESLDFTR